MLIVGAIAGSVASLIVPGRTPGGALGAVVVGILGGVLGGQILDALDVNDNLTWLGSLVVATLGTTAILFALRKADDGRGGGRSVGRRS